MRVVILADTMREAASFAKATGLRRSEWAYPSTFRTIDGIPMTNVVELPSYAGRRDRHAINAVVLRGMRRSPGSTRTVVSQARFDAMIESNALADFFADASRDEGVVQSA